MIFKFGTESKNSLYSRPHHLPHGQAVGGPVAGGFTSPRRCVSPRAWVRFVKIAARERRMRHHKPPSDGEVGLVTRDGQMRFLLNRV